jgi:hypothetical protein
VEGVDLYYYRAPGPGTAGVINLREGMLLMLTIILIVLVLLLLFGGFGYSRRGRRGI